MRKASAVIVLVIGCSLILWWFAGTPPAPRAETPERVTEVVPREEAPGDARGEIGILSTPQVPTGVDPRVAAASDGAPGERIPSQLFRADAYRMGRMQIFGEFWRTAESEWDSERYQLAEADEALLDGRESYQVYVYLRTCLEAPRSAFEADRYLARVQAAAEHNRRLQNPRRLERILSRVDAALARCEGLEGDLEPAAMAWLTRAAQRGYPLAQIAYYRSYRWLASRKPYLIFSDVQRIYAYRSLAPLFLDAAIGSGHAEAFVEMARALHEGIIFDRNSQAAYAYALAAEEAGSPELSVAADLLGELEPELSPVQSREARKKARELCDAYCL
ncbi:MAG: hypothetical protein R3200_03480 [Xanthomonadales bacterium]|nr:hypothetical protein [Xanthomonadales bacterium]